MIKNIGIVIVFGLLMGCCSSHNNKSSSANSIMVHKISEKSFVESVQLSAKEYEMTNNIIRRNAILNTLGKNMAQQLGDKLLVNSWSGKIEDIEEESPILGSEYASIVINLSAQGGRSVLIISNAIKNGSKAYQSLALLKNGDNVCFSGNFYQRDAGDLIQYSLYDHCYQPNTNFILCPFTFEFTELKPCKNPS